MSALISESVKAIAQRAKAVSMVMGAVRTADKNTALEKIAAALLNNQGRILAANQKDLQEAAGLSVSMQDRLRLNEKRVSELAAAVRQIAALPDPVGELLDTIDRPNGLHIEKRRVPLGLLAIIYEARPNVTVDAAALALKSGNCVLLRGSSTAIHSNKALVAVMREALRDSAVPVDAIALIEDVARESVGELLQLHGIVDAVIPRGGADLIRRVVQESKIPVLETGVGNCHIYVDASATIDQAVAICMNAKVQRPSVCNAAETFLFHRDVAKLMVDRLFPLLRRAGVEIRGDQEILKLDATVNPASDDDWATEYLALIVAVKVVADVGEACAHIQKYGTLHTEAVLAEDSAVIQTFIDGVDCAAVMVNASTRFTDGGEFGFGAEMGISNQKLHARGPIGLRELCTYKYIVRGNGQLRA